MDLKVIFPAPLEEYVEPTQKEIEKFIPNDINIDVEKINYGTVSTESYYDEMLDTPDILRIVKESEENGFDGIFIDCLADTGLEGAREIVDIPVVGPGRCSMLLAAELAHTFSVITVVENINPMIRHIALKAGINSKLKSIRAIDIPVLELEKNERLIEELVNESKIAIEENGAHAIILGCTGMMGLAEEVKIKLADSGYDIPIIYPISIGINYLVLLVRLNVKQSKITYMKPSDKERNILNLLK